ncbi:hypothetical protein CYMTET_50670 [Cymbomonas tetramitiformis]|uniref:Uncharacterized protein n=1 Tax=Cymbomonas tetramitiformis TaxID=36881 RepID=A0AAE0ETG8_9CHLO|nr:hypothetical protein CYMTET_50670 [Cymbomonas tetramitiformis]
MVGALGQGSSVLVDLVRRRDEGVLASLLDVRWRRLEDGFTVQLHFAPNKYFTNTQLEKAFHFKSAGQSAGHDEAPAVGMDISSEEHVLISTEETPIAWNDGMDVTQRVRNGRWGAIYCGFAIRRSLLPGA